MSNSQPTEYFRLLSCISTEKLSALPDENRGLNTWKDERFGGTQSEANIYSLAPALRGRGPG
jgi:hypothetical protein